MSYNLNIEENQAEKKNKPGFNSLKSLVSHMVE